MADKKITELVELTSLASADEFAVVDDDVATTKRVTYDTLATEIRTEAEALTGTTGTFSGDVTADNVVIADAGTIGSASDADAMVIASTGVVTFSQGIKLAASKGIDFSAYGSGTDIDSNLLDDYEEGTWSPEYDFSSGSATPGASDAGAYRKIGSVVIVTFRVSTDGLSSPTGAVDIINLPFAATGSNGGSMGVARDFSTDMPNIKARITGGQSKISIIKNATDAGFTSVQGSDFASGSDKNLVIGTLTYVTS